MDLLDLASRDGNDAVIEIHATTGTPCFYVVAGADGTDRHDSSAQMELM
jgi:hypothetical protein